jgi:hypothetical protein
MFDIAKAAQSFASRWADVDIGLPHRVGEFQAGSRF